MELLASQYHDNFAVGTCTLPCCQCLHIPSEHMLITLAILIVHSFQSLELVHKTKLRGMELLASQYNDNFAVGTCTLPCRPCSHISSENILITLAILIVHSFQSLELVHNSKLRGMELLASQYNDNFAVGTCTLSCYPCSHISSEHMLITLAILIVHSFQSLELVHKSKLRGMELLASKYNDNFAVGTCTLSCCPCSHISSEHMLITLAILIVHSLQSLELVHKSKLRGMELLASKYNDNFAVGTCILLCRACSHISSEHMLITLAILIVHSLQSLELVHKTKLRGMELLASQYHDNFSVGTCTLPCRLCSHISSEHMLITLAILIVHSLQSLELVHKTKLRGMGLLASQYNDNFAVGTCILLCRACSHISSEHMLITLAILIVHSLQSLELVHKT